MSAVMERLERWAAHLPSGEAIPISASEVEILAASAALSVKYGRKLRAAAKKLESDIQQGMFRYKDHRVVVL